MAFAQNADTNKRTRQEPMQPTNETEILNTALSLTLEWGEDWLQPVQSRLAKHYPQLSTEELDHYNTIVQKAMGFGWQTIEAFDFMNDTTSSKKYRAKVLESYSWINEENLSRLYSQSCYYALK